MNIAFYNGMLLQVTLHTTPNTDTCSSTITGNSTMCVDIWRIHRHKRKSYKMSITPGTDGHALNMSR